MASAALLAGAAAALLYAWRTHHNHEKHVNKAPLLRSQSILIKPAKHSAQQFRRQSTVTGAHKEELHAHAQAHSTMCTGILVHGCHLQADDWAEIVWGHPPQRLGRLPQAVLLAWEEDAKVIVFGTGASKASDGRLEGQYTLDFLFDHLDQLHDFVALRKAPLDKLQRFVRKIAMAELESQNTIQEAHEEDAKDGSRIFHGEIYASPSQTCYEGFEARDVVVVEPPHRGDRDRSLDELPFHEMVRRTFRVATEDKAIFLQDFDALLKRYRA